MENTEEAGKAREAGKKTGQFKAIPQLHELAGREGLIREGNRNMKEWKRNRAYIEMERRWGK